MNAHLFTLGGQSAWFHDEGFDYGPVHTFDALRLGAADAGRKVHVLVPRDYLETDACYPTLYMNDGQTALFPGGSMGKCWNVGQTMSALWQQGKIRRALIVAVHPLDRDREYTHLKGMPGAHFGGLDEYARYIAGPLKTFIDTNYRTAESAEESATIGSSHGGLAAFYTACHHPERFNRAFALSPSFWVGRGDLLNKSPLVDGVRDLLKDVEKRPKIWIDWGLNRDGAIYGAREMASLLQSEFHYELGRDLWVREDREGGHDEASWGRHFGLLMQLLYGVAPSDR